MKTNEEHDQRRIKLKIYKAEKKKIHSQEKLTKKKKNL